MNLIQELIDVYDRNQDEVGKVDGNGRTLLPIAHFSVNFDLEVTVTEDSEFASAVLIDKKQRATVIPATITSANRASNNAPYPLQDKIKYVAGDFSKYATREKDRKLAPEFFNAYQTLLKQWVSDENTPEEIGIIAKYIAKKQLIEDLLTQFSDEKTQDKIKSGGLFVRFTVAFRKEPWIDRDLFENWTNFYTKILKNELPMGVDYATGAIVPTTKLIEKNINPIVSKAALISANDSNAYTYRGTFLTDDFYSIGYEESQKMIHALKWLIRRQGLLNDTRTFLFWKAHENTPMISELSKLAGISAPIARMAMENAKKAAKEISVDAAQSVPSAVFNPAQDIDDHLNILYLDAATTGRMAIVYSDTMNLGELKENIDTWRNHCAVETSQSKLYVFSIRDIIESAYLVGPGGKRYETQSKQAMTRLLTSFIHGKMISKNIEKAIMNRVKRPMSYRGESRWKFEGFRLWRRDLDTLCAVANYNYRGELTMSLDPKNNKRDYLFGRMLAVADAIENNVLYQKSQNDANSSGNGRATTAMRFYSNFMEQPATTWRVIWMRVRRAYVGRLSKGSAYYYESILNEINELMTPEMIEDNTPLNILAYSGYRAQLVAMMKKNKDEKDVAEDE